MENYLSYPEEWLRKKGGFFTAKEISQQPESWRKVWQIVNDAQSRLNTFLAPLLSDPDLEIILTGAGSSAFIGDTLAPWLNEQTNLDVRSYGSTEIVASPLQYLSKNRKTLMISYARSGNSPESVATVKLADQIIKECYHLFITCNPDSELTQYAKKSDKIFELIMPPETHDQSFAMTSSISSMIMASILVLGNIDLNVSKVLVDKVAKLCHDSIVHWQIPINQLAQQSFQRLIYLGSSCFYGLSTECALKMLELTAGSIASRYDSILGVRHGPKFMINNESIVICLRSNDAYTRKYDDDLVKELVHDHIAKQVIVLAGNPSVTHDDFCLNSDLDDIWLTFPYLIFAQMFGFEKSMALGLSPDNPCPTGEVNRVVKGVHIYPFE